MKIAQTGVQTAQTQWASKVHEAAQKYEVAAMLLESARNTGAGPVSAQIQKSATVARLALDKVLVERFGEVLSPASLEQLKEAAATSKKAVQTELDARVPSNAVVVNDLYLSNHAAFDKLKADAVATGQTYAMQHMDGGLLIVGPHTDKNQALADLKASIEDGHDVKNVIYKVAGRYNSELSRALTESVPDALRSAEDKAMWQRMLKEWPDLKINSSSEGHYLVQGLPELVTGSTRRSIPGEGRSVEAAVQSAIQSLTTPDVHLVTGSGDERRDFTWSTDQKDWVPFFPHMASRLLETVATWPEPTPGPFPPMTLIPMLESSYYSRENQTRILNEAYQMQPDNGVIKLSLIELTAKQLEEGIKNFGQVEDYMIEGLTSRFKSYIADKPPSIQAAALAQVSAAHPGHPVIEALLQEAQA